MNRRELLRLGALGWLAPWLDGCLCWDEGAEELAPVTGEVVVVGAGAAGLSAAATLSRRGAQVTVLEARNRIGGRVWTDRTLGVPIDLGGSWIHGWEGNPLTALCADNEIEHLQTDYDSIAVYDASGKEVPRGELQELEAGWEGLTAEVYAASAVAERDISVGKALAAAVRGEKLSARERAHLDWRRATLEVTAASDLSDISLLGEDGKGFGGGDRAFPKGYHQVIEVLARGLEIRRGVQVRSVKARGKRVTVKSREASWEADAVVVALPLGVLKHGIVRFDPGVGSAREKAVERLGFGTLNKVALRFPRTFWPDDVDFLGYQSRTHGEYPVVLNAARLVKEPVLMAFTGGTFAERMESRSLETVRGEVMAMLRTIFGSAVAEPTALVRSTWHSDPLAGGSYSHLRVGADAADFDVLARPLSERVLFAGEATNRDYPGTVHGAHLSGLRAAREAAAVLAPR